jgi:hypothetical protein
MRGTVVPRNGAPAGALPSLRLGTQHGLREYALAYGSLGFRVLPLKGKEPAAELIACTHGSASTRALAERGADEEQIGYWFADPHVNVGIFCGAPSGGLVVLDFDCKEPPAEAELPPTPTVKTARGLHFYYRADGAVRNHTHPWGEGTRPGAPVRRRAAEHPPRQLAAVSVAASARRTGACRLCGCSPTQRRIGGKERRLSQEEHQHMSY